MPAKKKYFSLKKYQVPPPRKVSKGKFELRTIKEADSRYHVVRKLRQGIERMLSEVGESTLAKEMLCGRAVFLCGYLESQEVAQIEGQELDWRVYLQAVRSLADVLNKLGLDQAKKSAKSLDAYLTDVRKRKARKLKVVS